MKSFEMEKEQERIDADVISTKVLSMNEKMTSKSNKIIRFIILS